jgi:hypothetical protein
MKTSIYMLFSIIKQKTKPLQKSFFLSANFTPKNHLNFTPKKTPKNHPKKALKNTLKKDEKKACLFGNNSLLYKNNTIV